MTERKTYKTIQIETHHVPSGNPVCRSKLGSCIFLQTRRFGQTWICGYNSDELQESKTDEGYLQTSQSCILHSALEVKVDSDRIGLLKE